MLADLLRAQGQTLRQIANRLNAAGPFMPPPSSACSHLVWQAHRWFSQVIRSFFKEWPVLV
jgi:hypothetical protein